MGRTKWIYIIVANLLLISLGLEFFFSTRDFSALQMEKSKKIGACYTDMDNSYFDVLNNEISSVIEENGDRLITRDSMLSQEKQNNQIHELIQEGIAALIIAPVDWKKIKPALEEAKESGVPVLIVDSPVYDKELVACTVTSDNYNVGMQIANYFKSQRRQAKIILIESENSKAGMDRVQGFKDGLAADMNYHIVAEQKCNGTLEDSIKVMNSLIEERTYFDCVFAVNDPCASGAITLCEMYGMNQQVDFLSTDGSPEGKKLIQNNRMMATAAQFPTEMGNRAVESLYKILNGETCEKKILVPVKLITKYTIDSYDLEKWQ
ncbi:MAG: sugar ABC transporter substrate-binding protein [Lachnospiraceae bacterium]|nr:sugar ABC transporter substrate-binding protein [Lachnospiraceae bacterium]MDD3660560.1 sugar ABC transporter substrate-binding protein [Lachnospiraceae bacterium]